MNKTNKKLHKLIKKNKTKSLWNKSLNKNIREKRENNCITWNSTNFLDHYSLFPFPDLTYYIRKD